jgi:hypothetical protein
LSAKPPLTWQHRLKLVALYFSLNITLPDRYY